VSDERWTAPGSEPAAESPPPPPPPPAPPPGTAPFPGQAPPPFPGHAPPPAGYPPAPPGAYRSAEFRPGIIPLRPLALGDLYGAVLKAVRGNPAATIGLATLTTFVFLLPTTALGTWLAGLGSVPIEPGPSSTASETLPSGLGLGLLAVYLPSLGQLLSGILLAGFLAQVIGQAVLGRRVGLGETWRATRGRIPPMLGAVLVTVVVSLLVVAVLVGGPVAVLVVGVGTGDGLGLGLSLALLVLGALAAVLAAIYLSTKWAFATPAIVLERVGAVAGLRRSWQLTGSPTRGPFWRIFGLRLLTALLVGIAASVISLPISFLVGILLASTLADGATTGDLFVTQTLATGISGLVTGALTTPFSAGVDALLYVDARIRREGLDVRLVQTAQGAAPPPWPLTRP
jgi:hypothetical protein